MKRFKVAEHIIAIEADDCIDVLDLLPGFKPFEWDGNGDAVLTVYVSTTWEWELRGREIGQFDVGGTNHGVYLNDDGGYQFEVSDINGHLCARMQSNKDFSKCTVRLYEGTWNQQNFGLNNCMMMSYAFATSESDTILIHSSVIRCDGKAYLMTAPSGTGKSTHTRLWYDNIPGCDLMNDDNPVIRMVDGIPVAFGSPWSGKTPCYRNVQAPIGGIVRIRQKPENSIRKLKPIEAFAMLLPACSSMKWDERVYNGVCDSVSHFVATCNIWELGCLPNAAAAHLCHDTIALT